MSLGAGQQAQAAPIYNQGFESNSDFYSADFGYTFLNVVPSGGGTLGVPSSQGSANHAEIFNTPDAYDGNQGSFGYDYFDGVTPGTGSVYPGAFYTSIDVYVDPGQWTSGLREFGGNSLFWIDMTPRRSLTSSYGSSSDYRMEKNFRFTDAGGGSVSVAISGGTPFATFGPGDAGWYSFVFEYSKTGNMTTDPVNIDAKIFEAGGPLYASDIGVQTTPVPSSDLGGHSYIWLSVVNDGFISGPPGSGDRLAIDNIQFGLLPFQASAEVAIAPEPGTLVLMVAAGGLATTKRSRRKKKEQQTS